MATSAELQLYPLSTEDAQSIPLDIVRPKGLLYIPVAHSSSVAIDIPDEYDLVSIFATTALIIDFASAITHPVAGGSIASGIIVPEGVILTMKLPAVGNARIVTLSAKSGWCTIQNIQKWAGLGLRRQLGSR